MTKRTGTVLYDDAFKRKVIKEYLAGGCTKKDLSIKYHIGGKSAIIYWMRELGYKDSHHGVKWSRFKVESTLTSMPTSNKNKVDLEREIKELKRKLEDERIRSESYLRMIEKAEQELHISIKKKSDSK